MPRILPLVAPLFAAAAAHAAEPPGAPRIEDRFGRDLAAAGVTLVDWDGEIANPAIRIFVRPPAGASLPERVTLSSPEPRLYFDLPSETGAAGPRKTIELKGAGDRVPVRIAIFPDRDGDDETHVLRVEAEGAGGGRGAAEVPIRVLDGDRPGAGFPLTVDFSRDRTGFFAEEPRRAVVERAAADWTFFLEDVKPDEVAPGAERTFIWSPEGFGRGDAVTNARAYTGFLLYAYGIHSPEIRSGGEPSREGGFQTAGGRRLAVRRSGGLEIETAGNFNTIGWLASLDPAEAWKGTNLKEVRNDLYSIAHHEIGHSLCFNPANPLFAKAKSRRRFGDAALKAYFGADPEIDRHDHFAEAIDPASGRGAYGHEYFGEMPKMRWLVTKTDVLALAACGWKLRETSALRPLSLAAPPLPEGTAGERYEGSIQASGGIPAYGFEIARGSLPEGLSLDSFTGRIAGIPSKAGMFAFTTRVRDQDERAGAAEREFSVEIRAR